MKIKICGITHPDDAAQAVLCGANYIGVVFSKSSKRNVSVQMAKDIVKVTKHKGAIPVGVFVDQDENEIISICEQTGIECAQLHGETARQALPIVQSLYTIIYAMPSKTICQLPPSIIPLYDSSKGGSGTTFNWHSFSAPKREWFLAGGLTINNIREAIILLNPSGVDVSSGVEGKHTVRKDPNLIRAFINIVNTIGNSV